MSTYMPTQNSLFAGITMVYAELTLCFTLITLLLKPGLGTNVTDLGCIGTVCYWVVGPADHWDVAGKKCRDFNGGHLATIEDDKTNTYLMIKTHQLGVEPYIGVVSTRIPWSWVNGAVYNGRIEDREEGCNSCALLKLNAVNSESDIIAGDCFKELPFACSKPGQPSTNWKLDYVSSSIETWPRARQRCKQMGMDLAVFPDIPLGSVAAVVKMETSFSNFWIGAYSRKWISASSGREVFYTKAHGGVCDDFYLLGLRGDWPASQYCCFPSLCALGETGGTYTPSGGPKPASGEGTTEESSQSRQEGFSIVYQIIIPVLCSLVVCVLTNIVTCVIWRRVTSTQIQKLTDDLERRYRAKSKKGSPEYEELHLQDDPHAYTEIKG